MLTDWGRKNFKFILEPVAWIMRTLHFSPDMITLLGVLLSVGVAYLVIQDRLLAAGLLYVAAAGADAIDGTLARQLGQRRPFGAFWDSTLDRMGEAIVISSIGYWAAARGDLHGVMLAFVALVTSYLVSYTRARAEGLGLECKVGIGTRVERFVVMLAALLFSVPLWGLALVALTAGITVIQRIYAVWRQTREG